MEKDHPTTDEVLTWTKDLSNWNRWGSEDELGTLNYITDDVRREAISAARHGVAVSCAWEIGATPRPDGKPNHFMLVTGEGLTSPDPDRHVHVASDLLEIAIHGHSVTHLDALSHFFWDARMYNGRSAQKVTTERGAIELGIETVRDGIVTRGVLIDVAGLRGVPHLEPGEAVTPADLEEAEKRQGIQIRSGDALLLHTGFGVYRLESNQNAEIGGASWPGWHAACLPWLHRREVALLGNEAANEAMPNPYGALSRYPIHSIGLPAMGLWLLDNLNLGRLVEECRARQQWDFLFTVAPLLIRGATGSPVNPLALL